MTILYSLIKNKEGQIAIEFSFMMMLGFTFLVVVLTITSVFLVMKSDERTQNAVKEEVQKVQKEIIIASSVEPGYKRTIEIPIKILNQDFAIIQSETLLEFRMNNGLSYTAVIPRVSGLLNKGTNTITNQGGVVIN